MKKVRLPEDVLAYFRQQGARGGKARAKKYTPEQLSEMGKKGGRPKKVAQAAPVMAVMVAEMPAANGTPGPSPLELLEEQIDDCLVAARQIAGEDLDDVITLLRKARNAVVWKLGE